MMVLLVALGAAVGAPMRYWTDRVVRSRHDTVYPWGTLAVNLVASLVLGGLGELSVEGGVGFCTGRLLRLRGSTPSGGGMSKGLLVGNCFWSSARKSSSPRVEKDVGFWERSQKLSMPR